MLQLSIPYPEKWDPVKEVFIYTPDTKVQLEHSLLSIAKWEAHYHKPFINTKMDDEETIYYVAHCMCVTKNVDEDIFRHMDYSLVKRIKDYIADPMTATPNLKGNGGHDEETITSELIYYWMVSLNIPWEAEKWHLNRLLKLIELSNWKNTPPEKRSKADMAKSRTEENARRRAKWNTRG